MKKSVFLFCLLIHTICFSQYYYNDVIANQQSNHQFQLLKQAKVSKIKAVSIGNDNQIQSDFSLEEIIDLKNNSTITNTKINSGEQSVLKAWFENNQITKTDETTKGVNIQLSYTYDKDGKLSTVSSITTDTAFAASSSETHIWQYNNSLPTKMLKIKNGSDTTTVDFILDEQGNIAEEHWHKKNTEIETYYYYYNSKKQLTDIVRFNKRAQKLLPDYLFEYDNNGNIIKMTQVPAGSNNYFVWEYAFNTNGLKQKEVCSNRAKTILGTIEYRYQ